MNVEGPTLERTLRLPDLIFLVIGTVIGSGIFIVPAVVLRHVGSDAGLALTVWITGGVLSVLGALSYAELGAMRPSVGGLYVFINDAFGSYAAFLFGWTMFFVLGNGAIATLSVAFATYAGEIVQLSGIGESVVAVAMILVVGAVNVLGTRRSARVQNVSTLLKAGALFILSAAILFLSPAPGPMRWFVVSGEGFSWTAVGVAMISVLWAYEGWHYVTFSVGETRNPQKIFPTAIAVGTLAIVFLYILANIAYVVSLGPVEAAQSERIAADAVTSALGREAGIVVTLAILVSMFSAANGILLTSTRVYFRMAQDGLFFRILGSIHPRFGTPFFAIIVSVVWSALLALSGTFEQLMTYVVFIGWIFYALGALSVIVLRRRFPNESRPYRVPLYPWVPIIFVVTAMGIAVNTLSTQVVESVAGISLVVLGTPAYFLWRRRRSSGAT